MSTSAFGVVHTISKRRKQNDEQGAAIATAGGVAATTGLVGGGIPGINSDSEVLANFRDKSKPWHKRAGAGLASMRGGVFGYRKDAHQKQYNTWKKDTDFYAGKDATRAQMYQRGRTAGKLEPELKIIHAMKRGRKLSYGLLGGGLAATAYGADKMREKKPKVPKNLRYEFGKTSSYQRKEDRTNGAMVGGGLAAAGLSQGITSVLQHQGKKWTKVKDANLEEAARIIPKMTPQSTGADHEADPKKYLDHKSKKQAYDAGVKRGTATQAKYFARIYGSGKTANIVRGVRNPALAVAATGGTAMLANRERKKHQ